MPRMKCGNCQDVFDAKREDAKFCCARCRVAANRAGKSCEPSPVDSVTPKRETVTPETGRCEFCGESMSVGRRPKRFCSARCRVYANRGKSPGAATGKPKRQPVTPKAAKRNKRQGDTGKAPRRNTTPEPFYVYQQHRRREDEKDDQSLPKFHFDLHRFEVYAKRNGDMWMHPYVYEVAEVPKRPDPSVDEPWPTTPFVKFDELKWHPQRQREKQETRSVLYPKPGNKNVTYCPGGRAYQSKDKIGDVKYDYMSEKQARKFVEFVESEPEWHKPTPEPKPKMDDPVDWVSEWLERLKERQSERELHLKTLGVTDDNQQAVKRAYHHLSVQHHPDHGGDTAEFKKINDAYKALVG